MEFDETKLIDYLQGNLSDSDLKELNAWRNNSEENRAVFSEVARLRILNKYKQYNNFSETVGALNRLKRTIRRKTLQRRISAALSYSAVILFAIAILGYGYFKWNERQFITLVAGEGSGVRKMELADSSMVWLHEMSELRIPKSFSAKQRKVSLKGRAFFDVKHDSYHPFLVSSKNACIKVTGTTFDLSVTPDEKTIEAILVTGQIVLQDSRHKDILQMHPGEKAVFESSKNTVVVETVDPNTLTAWYLDQVVFENETLRNIVDKLNLIYKINIVIKSEELANKRFRFVVNKDEPISEVLNNLNYLGSVKVFTDKDEIYIEKY